MEDDEEIDIIGVYDDISNISSGQLLSCDYTVHPNWVNENPDNNFWSDSVPKNENLERNVKVLQSDEIAIEEPEPVSDLIANEWTGEQIASPTNVIFEEDIPAALTEEIVFNNEFVEEEYMKQDQNQFYEEDLGEEEEVEEEAETEGDETQDIYQFEPAAFETLLPDKNLKYIGPTSERSLLKVQIENKLDKTSHASFTKRSALKKSSKSTRKKFSSDNYKSNNPKRKKGLLSKFREKIYSKSLKKNKSNLNKNNLTKEKSSLKLRNTKLRRIDKNVTISHEAENISSKDEIPSETIVKVDKCETESDIEIDIGSDVDNPVNVIPINPLSDSHGISSDKIDKKDKIVDEKLLKLQKLNESISDELKKQLKDTSIPKEELIILPNSNEASELEKYVNFEFFDGRASKTPAQYLRIRNHILTMWNSVKPNYISKTAVRNGLKHGGDVNTISRIHKLLEQIGAINFGHDGDYFNYIRPLKNFVENCIQTSSINRTRTSSWSKGNNSQIALMGERRQPHRTQRFVSLSESIETLVNDDINYTIVHMDGVVRPDPPRLNSDKIIPIYEHIRSEFDLVKCLKFSEGNIAPFKVSITLSTLVCMQLHSFSSKHEVMGFLGGYCSKSVGRNKISLTRYKPCRTSQQSGTMCEMCPISQVEQSISLSTEGFELLGWFHSHPLFPPTPSRTDIQTQKDMQLQFSTQNDKPFVGLILSCLNLSFKCIYILPRDLHTDSNGNELPYEINVDIIKDCTNFRNDVTDVLIELRKNCDINLNEFITKFMNSIGNFLNHFGYTPEMLFNNILNNH